MKFKHRLIALNVALATGATAPLAFGQSRGLEEIVVSAQRREENLQSAPVSVMALTGERLSEINASDPQVLADFVPNVSMGDGTGRGNGGTQISIRGVNEARVSPVLDPAVGIYIDDVYYGRPQTAFLKLLDVERVEVLRGPQGTLFGKNSTGGAIRYITKRPDFDGISGYVEGTAGNYDHLDVRGAVNIPLTNNLALRAAAAALNRDGFIERLADGRYLGKEDTRFGMAQLRWQPNEDVDINLGIDYTKRDVDDGPTKLIDYSGAFGTTTDVGNTSASRAWNLQWGNTVLVYDPVIPVSLYQVGGEGLLPVNDSESIGVTLNISWQLSDSINLKAITGYRDVSEYSIRDPDDQANAETYFDDYIEEGVDFWSQEFQLSGLAFDSRLNWVAGVFYSEEEPYRLEFQDNYSLTARGALNLNDDAFQTTKSLGLYAQGTFDVTEKLAVTAGLRYTRDKKNYRLSQVAVWDYYLDNLADQLGLTDLTPGNLSCDVLATGSCVSQPEISGGDTFSSWTPRFAIEYQWTDDIMTYAAASRGFKSGGTNDTVADIITPFQPETIWSYEVGIRTEFMDNRVRLNATYFYMDYKNKQITVAPVGGNNVDCINRCTTNAGDAKIDGAEIEALFAPVDNLVLHANIGILDAKWKSVIPGAGVTLDTKFSRAPKLTYNVGGRYDFPAFAGGTLTAFVDYSYKDEQESSPQDSTTLTIPEYDLLTARLKYTSPDRDWEVSLWCTNCADEEYITGGAAWGASTDNTPFNYKPSTHPAFTVGGNNPNAVAPPGISLVNVGAPRMWGVDFRYRF